MSFWQYLKEAPGATLDELDKRKDTVKSANRQLARRDSVIEDYLSTMDPVLEEGTSHTNGTALPFSQLSTERTQTIVLIHGAFVNRSSWDTVTPYLADYHLLLPDLPGHGEAVKDAQTKRYTKELSAKLLADLIKQHAHNGRAHVIGHSMGASVAVELASAFPEVVDQMFVSGFLGPPDSPGAAFSAIRKSGLAGHALWLDQRLEACIPRPVIRWLMDGTELPRSDLSRCNLQLCKEVMYSDGTWPKPWKARTLIVAAGKSGIAPTADSSKDAVKLRDIGRENCAETQAYVHPKIRHPWNWQDPKLFAETARAWFEGRETPIGFVEL